MKALSVRQPWASLIARGRKTVELRSRPTKHRGPLLIVASLAPYDAASLDRWGDGPRGVALCVVDVVDCRPATPADTEAACGRPPPDHFAWVLANPRPVEALPIKGRLGLYEVTLPE